MKQELVQSAMEGIGQPCTTEDIEKYLRDNNMMGNDHKWDQKIAIARALQSLHRWEIVDSVKQGHSKRHGLVIWYLRKNGPPEHDERNCEACQQINSSYSMRVRQLNVRYNSRRYRTDNSESPTGPGTDYVDEFWQ